MPGWLPLSTEGPATKVDATFVATPKRCLVGKVTMASVRVVQREQA